MLERSKPDAVRTSSSAIVGTGEMAERIRAFNWESTGIGPVDEWPDTLLAMVNMMLSTRHPILLLWGPDMVLIYNDAFRPILTDRHPKGLGSFGRDFWTDVWPVVGEQLESVLRDGKDVFFENALVPILRNRIVEDAYFNYSYSPVYGANGDIAGIITICQDVTATIVAGKERALAQEALNLRQQELDKTLRALRSERARLLSVVQQAPVFFVLLEGPQYVISMVNPLYIKLMGNRDALGKPLAEALPEAVEQGYVTLLDQVVTSGVPVTREDARFDVTWEPGHPPEERYVNFVYQPLREADNTISGIIVLGVDVTENKRAQKALVQSEKLAAVGRLAASIAHEINNPLEAVTNLLYLARSTDSLQQVQNYLDIAEHELRRMSAITTQTLAFNKQSTRPRPVTTEELLSSVIMIYQSRLRNAGIILHKRLRSNQPVLCLDGEIRQVLNNLVSNAIDAMQTGDGQLLLRSRDATNWKTGEPGIVITVADTGMGIKPDVVARIFEPFFTTKGASGTGLGLWVSNGIVGRHNGYLRVRSSHKHARTGTVFTLFLPCDGKMS